MSFLTSFLSGLFQRIIALFVAYEAGKHDAVQKAEAASLREELKRERERKAINEDVRKSADLVARARKSGLVRSDRKD